MLFQFSQEFIYWLARQLTIRDDGGIRTHVHGVAVRYLASRLHHHMRLEQDLNLWSILLLTCFPSKYHKPLGHLSLALPTGFEPAYQGLEDPCLSIRLREYIAQCKGLEPLSRKDDRQISNLLQYQLWEHCIYDRPGRNRTFVLRFWRPSDFQLSLLTYISP